MPSRLKLGKADFTQPPSRSNLPQNPDPELPPRRWGWGHNLKRP